MIVTAQLSASCSKTPERQAWLKNLPSLLQEMKDRWRLQVGQPFEHGGTCSWVAPVLRSDGTSAVLKLGMPHTEGEGEIEGLRIWNGDPTVRLLEADDRCGAILLERCLPGTTLRSEPEPAQDTVIAALLKRLWNAPSPPNLLQRFRHLSALVELWSLETLAQCEFWPDAALVGEGLQLMQELARPAHTDTLLVTDLHAGNVLKSEREPWLVIDPKPFVGDRSYDPVQHLINCEARLQADPIGLVRRVADLAEVDSERVRRWTFARAAADPRDDWKNTRWTEIARKLAC
jgi:streptomycin 6-kinase